MTLGKARYPIYQGLRYLRLSSIVPPELLDDLVALSLGRVHPNDDEWDSLEKRKEDSVSAAQKPFY